MRCPDSSSHLAFRLTSTTESKSARAKSAAGTRSKLNRKIKLLLFEREKVVKSFLFINYRNLFIRFTTNKASFECALVKVGSRGYCCENSKRNQENYRDLLIDKFEEKYRNHWGHYGDIVSLLFILRILNSFLNDDFISSFEVLTPQA